MRSKQRGQIQGLEESGNGGRTGEAEAGRTRHGGAGAGADRQGRHPAQCTQARLDLRALLLSPPERDDNLPPPSHICILNLPSLPPPPPTREAVVRRLAPTLAALLNLTSLPPPPTREAVVRRLAPTLAAGKGTLRNLFDRLVANPTEGVAWQVRGGTLGGDGGATRWGAVPGSW